MLLTLHVRQPYSEVGGVGQPSSPSQPLVTTLLDSDSYTHCVKGRVHTAETEVSYSAQKQS